MGYMRYSVYFTKTSILVKLAIAAIDTFISFTFLVSKCILAYLQYTYSIDTKPHPSNDSMIHYESFGFTLQFTKQ